MAIAEQVQAPEVNFSDLESIPVLRKESTSLAPTFLPGLSQDMVIAQALARLETGWIQGRMNTEEGYCLVGALHAGGPVPTEVYERLAKKLGITSFDHPQVVFNALMAWNDQPGRTKEEVIELLQSV